MRSKRRYALKKTKRTFHLIGIFLLHLEPAFLPRLVRIGQLQRRQAKKEKEIVQLTEYNTQLRRKIENLQSDSYVGGSSPGRAGLCEKGRNPLQVCRGRGREAGTFPAYCADR